MKPRIQLHDRTFEVMIPAEQIAEAVAGVAARLCADYRDRPEPPLLVGVLNGAFMFVGDLVRRCSS